MNNKILRSNIPLGEVTKNLGTMFLNNRERHGTSHAFAERIKDKYCYYSWNRMVDDVVDAALFLKEAGYKKKDRIAFISPNSYRRLVFEMAVMSSGLVSVPIFVGYGKKLMSQLIEFSEVRMLVTENSQLLHNISLKAMPEKLVLLNGSLEEMPEAVRSRGLLYSDILPSSSGKKSEKHKAVQSMMLEVESDDLMVIMYTSGTSSFPKGVQLSHRNILSQQRALELLWNPEPGMRFLCYLPWHHSFGGLFERFFALHTAGCLSVDDSWGKDIDRLFLNFSEIKPHIYLSVPKTYQEIVSRVLKSKEFENLFFHEDLKFIFTAAAPLPLSISDVFKEKKVPVVEGWGLTETSPCNTLTERSLERRLGVVGGAIPGVEVKLGSDNEILIKGPNVMKGYLRDPQKTAEVFDEDKWFKTGDLGEVLGNELKIVSRKDRMFKLSNGEKVFPSVIEEDIRTVCKYIKYVFVFGKGLRRPFLLIFPNAELLSAIGKSELDKSDCECPDCLGVLSKCLANCLEKINQNRPVAYERIQKAIIINRELSLERNELTPSFKLIPRSIEQNYGQYIKLMEEQRFEDLPRDALVVDVRS